MHKHMFSGNMEVICGSYEELTIGLKLTKNGEDYEFETSFTDHSHTGNVKTVAVSSRGFLATGSSDESIKLFNLKSRKELGSLLHHDGSISSLQFHGKAHMFSGSEDGTVAIWKVGSWECLRNLKGHKEAIYDISIHPSGKMALSVSKDKTMRTWNLITGKAAYVTNIKAAADHVEWTPAGDRYIVVTDRKLDVYSVESASIEHTIQQKGRIHAVRFIGDEVLVVAGEGGQVTLYTTADCTQLYTFNTDTVRIKGLYCCSCDDDEGSDWLVTGSSDGMVKLWKLSRDGQSSWSHELVCEQDIKFRITSMAVWRQERNTNTQQAASEMVEMEEEEIEEMEEEEVESGVESSAESSHSETEVQQTAPGERPKGIPKSAQMRPTPSKNKKKNQKKQKGKQRKDNKQTPNKKKKRDKE